MITANDLLKYYNEENPEDYLSQIEEKMIEVAKANRRSMSLGCGNKFVDYNDDKDLWAVGPYHNFWVKCKDLLENRGFKVEHFRMRFLFESYTIISW